MAQSKYMMNYSNFIGVDMSSDPRVVARNRLAYSVNMWRDYESEQGAAVETFPGFRSLFNFSKNNVGHIIGMWPFESALREKYLIIHAGEKLFKAKIIKYNELTQKYELIETPNSEEISDMTLSEADTAFTINNSLYIISNKRYFKVFESKEGITSEIINVEGNDKGKSWVPTTYYNGQPYEQRNALSNIVFQVNTDGGIEDNENNAYINVPIYELVEYDSSENKEQILSVEVNGKTFEYDETNLTSQKYRIKESNTTFPSGETQGYSELTLQFLKSDIYNETSKSNKEIKIKYKAYATHFNTIGNLVHFQNDNNISMAEAILGCTKSAVYDGRVFLTGNPELPNTVFYSQRNLTGANDPTYFGVYNYFNDGDGNTPNVDMLATSSMLMVIKGDTVQDGSVYYHVGADNPHSDNSVRDLVPRIYPSTTGAAGLGSAGDTSAYSLSCNFLDDPVFLSRRGLEGVSKEQLNAERIIQHRSSNIDRLLIKEDLAHASLAEWKGYLVICCNGHIYLADSRTLFRHQDGSYQYEWFYLEGVGTYEKYDKVYKYLTRYPYVRVPDALDSETYEPIEWKNVPLSEFSINGKLLNEEIELCTTENKIHDTDLIQSAPATYSGITNHQIDVMYAKIDGKNYLVDHIDEKQGIGEFCGAKQVLTVGELLIFATDFDICIFNTDKRGVSIKDENDNIIREVDRDKIDSSWYNFNGIPYVSGCSIRLDDCERKNVTKNTVYGTTVARLKMMPGSRCLITASTNGRDWIEVGKASASRLDFSDIRFDNFSFAEDEDEIYVFPELSRGWVSKQYYFYSEGFCEPFGLYELSYNYNIAGRIRY